MESSTPSSLLNIGLKCSPAHSPTPTLPPVSTAFQTPSRKSSRKLANSPHHDPGQRLAGYVVYSKRVLMCRHLLPIHSESNTYNTATIPLSHGRGSVS